MDGFEFIKEYCETNGITDYDHRDSYSGYSGFTLTPYEWSKLVEAAYNAGMNTGKEQAYHNVSMYCDRPSRHHFQDGS